MSRHGKIARLPRGLREELSRRLHAGQEGEPLLAWLNPLPELQTLLKEEFAGVPISKQNLSEWRKGGFVEWEFKGDCLWEARETAAESREVDAVTDGWRVALGPGIAAGIATVPAIAVPGEMRDGGGCLPGVSPHGGPNCQMAAVESGEPGGLYCAHRRAHPAVSGLRGNEASEKRKAGKRKRHDKRGMPQKNTREHKR